VTVQGFLIVKPSDTPIFSSAPPLARGTDPQETTLNPAGDHLIYGGSINDKFGTWLIDPASGAATRIETHFGLWPAGRSDGREIVYVNHDKDEKGICIFKVNIDGSNPTQLTDGQFCDTGPSYFPDGNRIVFARATRLRDDFVNGGSVWEDWDVYAMDRDGSHVTALTSRKFRELDPPSVSSDGTRIIFAAAEGDLPAERANHRGIFVVDLNNAGVVTEPPVELKLGDGFDYNREPRFSPDGRRIAFVCRLGKPGAWPDRSYQVCTADADGQHAKPLISDHQRLYFPTFSPDGRTIYFVTETRVGDDSISRMNADGGDVAVLKLVAK
jgi:Tol biopolymer transport system component